MAEFTAFDPTTKAYYKRNFGDAFSKIIPTVYSLKDFEVSGMELDPLDVLLDTHIKACDNIDTVLFISATYNFSAINTISGIYPFFVKQNANTRVTPFYFERDILDPLDFQFEAFETSGEWKAYLDNTLLPALTLNQPATSVINPKGLAKNLADSYGVDTDAEVHEYLINSLGWMYLLNTSAPVGGSYDPSAYVSQKLTELFIGGETHTLEGVQGFQEYLWKNYLDLTHFQREELIPVNYISGVSSSTYTSGTQNLERLNTLVEVLYSPLYADRRDFKVKETFEDFLIFGSFDPAEVYAGPFAKLLRVLGYSYQDTNSPIDKLESLYDIDNCPEEYLPHLGDLIGWRLIGSDPGRWRSQLRNAVRIYKAKGTAFATQLLLNTLFGESSTFNLSGTMFELHESYIPNMIYYLLATGTKFFNQAGYKDDPYSFWTPQDALDHGVVSSFPSDTDGEADYSTSDADSNIRRCVDKILKVLRIAHPTNFLLGGGFFPPVATSPDAGWLFEYRDRVYPMPPFEETRYYEKVQISDPLLTTLASELQDFEVSAEYITSTIDFIAVRSVSSVDNISIGNRFVLFTSAFETPVNFSDVLADI